MAAGPPFGSRVTFWRHPGVMGNASSKVVRFNTRGARYVTRATSRKQGHLLAAGQCQYDTCAGVTRENGGLTPTQGVRIATPGHLLAAGPPLGSRVTVWRQGHLLAAGATMWAAEPPRGQQEPPRGQQGHRMGNKSHHVGSRPTVWAARVTVWTAGPPRGQQGSGGHQAAAATTRGQVPPQKAHSAMPRAYIDSQATRWLGKRSG